MFESSDLTVAFYLLKSVFRIFHIVELVENKNLVMKVGTVPIGAGNGKWDSLAVEREALSRLVGSPHIIQLDPNLASTVQIGADNFASIAMDFAPNGDILDYVQDMPFDEILARTYFFQLMWALKSCHAAGVYHRDVKLENILLDCNFSLILADFGLSYVCRKNPLVTSLESSSPPSENSDDSDDSPSPEFDAPERLISGYCGSPGSIAPEIVNPTSLYLGSAVDVWSSACLLFAMISGTSAFEIGTIAHRFRDPWL